MLNPLVQQPSNSSISAEAAETVSPTALSASPTTTQGQVPFGASKWSRANEAKVDSFFDRARQGIHCSLFCGGLKCKHEDWTVGREKKNVHPAIEGLNSNWVGDVCIASQRPSTSLFLKHLLISQFKAKAVTGVFNLQEKGEHASCGPDGIYERSGYSYDGEQDLMRHGIHYYEFPWPDMTAPDTDIVLRSVQVMDSHVRSSGKVLVHCHAGLGRTGLLIACYFVYTSKMKSDDAIRLVRLSRPGAVQTNSQVEFVKGFERHLWDLQLAFRVEISDPRVDLEIFMKRQRAYLHGAEGDRYRFVPKPLHYMLCRAISLAQTDGDVARAALEAIALSGAPSKQTLQAVYAKVNRGELNVTAIDDEKLLMFLSIDWFRSMTAPVVTESAAQSLIDYMKQMPSEREPIVDVIVRTFNKLTRHTLGLVVSALYIIALKVDEPLKRFAFRCVSEAFTHTHVQTKQFFSRVETELLGDFFSEWGHSVGALYFDDSIVPKENRTIGVIAAGSQLTLDQTSGANNLLKERGSSVEANDVKDEDM